MTALCTCPTCGQPIAAPRIPVEALLAVQMGEKPRRLIEELVHAYPGAVRHERLLHVLYGDDPNGGPDGADRIIGVMVCKLRPKLARYGWTIPKGKTDPGAFTPRRLAPLEA